MTPVVRLSKHPLGKTLNPKLLPMLHHWCANVFEWFPYSQLR